MSGYEGDTVRLSPRCPMCQGELEEGYVRDRAYGGDFPAEWVEGEPQRSWLTGVNLRSARRYIMESSRCTSCGYVALYANNRITD